MNHPESQKQLEAILQSHQKWLDSGGAEGKQADFRGTDLQGVVFPEANLTDASFRHADLRQADLEKTSGLLPPQLGGADLSRARLPAGALEPERLQGQEECSKICQRLFLAMQLACGYSILTSATTTDALLLSNEATSRLPIINTEIAIVSFYWTAPILLLILYVYFHLYLQRLWERSAALPAIFPDGTTFDQKAYPWLLAGIVVHYLERLRIAPPRLGRWQFWLSVLTGWCAVPLTLAILWVRCLPRHDRLITGLQLMVLWISVVAAIALFRLMVVTLRGLDPPTRLHHRAWQDRASYALKASVVPLGVLLFLGFLGAVSYGAIRCDTDLNIPVAARSPHKSDRALADPRRWAPILLHKFRYRAFADLDDADISIKTAGWTEGDLSRVIGASLAERNLRNASARNAFFARADLYHADLSHAYLFKADFRGAVLDTATLAEADLGSTDFRGAKLRWADLTGADVDGARFESASLDGVILKDVKNASCDLTKAASAAGAIDVPKSCLGPAGEEERP